MSIPTLKKHDNGFFYVHWTTGRRSRCVSTRSKNVDAAKAFLAEWLKLEQEAPSAPQAVLTLADLWPLYFEQHVRENVASIATAEYVWKNLSVAFASLTVEKITSGAVERYVKDRKSGSIGKPSTTSTIRRELVAMRACLNWCASEKRKLIRPEHIRPFDLPPENAPRDRWLRVKEIEALLAAATEMREGERLSRLERFLWLALETAARKGAIVELQWSRVDLDIGVIDYIDRERRQTKKRRAVVPISAKLLPVLRRAFAERQGPYVLDHLNGWIEKAVYAAAARAGLDDVSPHVLRHTAATHMARNGVPLWKIAKVLGNSLAVVEKVYAKHCPDDLRAAVDLIST